MPCLTELREVEEAVVVSDVIEFRPCNPAAVEEVVVVTELANIDLAGAPANDAAPSEGTVEMPGAE
jgi:hypothetical protein